MKRVVVISTDPSYFSIKYLKIPQKPGKNLATNRAERKENARWAFLAKEPDCRKGLSKCMKKPAKEAGILVVPSLLRKASESKTGLEPGRPLKDRPLINQPFG